MKKNSERELNDTKLDGNSFIAKGNAKCTASNYNEIKSFPY